MNQAGLTITSTKRRGNQIKIVLKSIARPASTKKSSPVKSMQRSPTLAFFSGPGFESRELELDLRDLVGININELDDSLKDIILDEPKSSVADADDIDNESIASEISTCSSAVTVALEPVDEEPKPLVVKLESRPPPVSPASSRSAEPWSCPSSSEAEEEDNQKRGRKSKKISNLFSFNSGPANASSSHLIGLSENHSDRNSVDRKKSRRPSLTRRISPLAFGRFSTSSPQQNNPDGIHEPHSERDPKKLSSQSKMMNRKLSLTKFQKSGSTDKLDMSKKRRNTDPNLLQKQKSSTIVESEAEKMFDGEDTSSPERLRKVSINALAPTVQELKKNDIRLEPEEVDFKDDDIKIKNLIGDVLRSHMLSMVDFRKETCDRTGKSICKILKSLVESIKESEGMPSKVVCLTYIGAVRDQGIFMSTQALWDSSQDNFAAASFRNEAVYGLAVVIATPYI